MRNPLRLAASAVKRVAWRPKRVRLVLALIGLTATLSVSPQAQAQDPPRPTGAAPEEPVSSPADPVAAEPAEDLDTLMARALAEIDKADEATDPEVLRGILDELRKLIEKVYALDPVNERLPYLRGSLLAYSGRLGDALEELDRYLKTRAGRNDWKGHRQLGDVYMNTNYPSMALARYESANTLKPNDPKVLLGLSRTSAMLGKREQAAEYATKAVEFAQPDKRVPFLQIASRTLIQQEQWNEADKFAKEAIERSYEETKTTPGKMLTLQTIDALIAMRAEIANGRLRAKPDTVQAYLDLADLAKESAVIRGKIAQVDALTVIDRGITATEPNPPVELFERKAKFLDELGRADEAKAVYEKILEKHPEHAGAKAFLARAEPGHATPSTPQ